MQYTLAGEWEMLSAGALFFFTSQNQKKSRKQKEKRKRRKFTTKYSKLMTFSWKTEEIDSKHSGCVTLA